MKKIEDKYLDVLSQHYFTAAMYLLAIHKKEFGPLRKNIFHIASLPSEMILESPFTMLPVHFLFRHSIELRVKHILFKQNIRFDKEHSLKNLLVLLPGDNTELVKRISAIQMEEDDNATRARYDIHSDVILDTDQDFESLSETYNLLYQELGSLIVYS